MRVLRKETLTPYDAGRGARTRAAMSFIGSFFALWMALGCSDSRDGPEGSAGADGSDSGGTDGAFTDNGADTGGGKADAHSDAPLLPWKAVPVDGTLCRDG